MTSRSAAVYGAGGVLLVACLAAANMPEDRDPLPAQPARVDRASTADQLAADVGAQAARLHARLAQAPIPGANGRNPFAFHEPRATRSLPATVHAAVAEDPAPAFVAPPPPLTLMGIAEETLAAGVRRTAIIGGDGDALYMVGEGEAVGDRYRVRRIGADAVELEDAVTSAYRRIALR